MKSKLKLLKLPENDYISACISTFINDGLNHPDVDKSFEYQEAVILGLVNYYGQWPDDIYAAHLHNHFLELLAILQQYRAKEEEPQE